MLVTPIGPVEDLNITFDQHGRMTGWIRGDLNVANVFDNRTGNMVATKLGNRINYRYIYKSGNKVHWLCLCVCTCIIYSTFVAYVYIVVCIYIYIYLYIYIFIYIRHSYTCMHVFYICLYVCLNA